MKPARIWLVLRGWFRGRGLPLVPRASARWLAADRPTVWASAARSAQWIMPPRGAVWRIDRARVLLSQGALGMTVVTAADTLVKQPGESKIFKMDFSALLAPNDAAIDEVMDITFTPDDLTGDTLSTGSPTIVDGTLPPDAAYTDGAVAFRVEGGLDGVTYRVQVEVIDTLGDTHIADGLLLVSDE